MKLFIILGLIILSGCSVNNVDKGLLFLKNSYNNCNYDDEYLKFVYPGEDLGSVNECKVSYRLVDAFYNVKIIERDFENKELIQKQINDANLVFNDLIPKWRNAEIFNTLESNNEGVALDTYCILAYYYEDKEMVDNFVNYLNEDKNWLKDDLFKEDRWRNIADETWCIRGMIKTNQDKELIDDLIEIKIKESDDFKDSKIFRVAVLYHMILVFLDYEEIYDYKFDGKKQEYINELASTLNDNEVKDNLIMKGNILEVLSKADYNKGLLRNTYNELINEQNKDGSWGEDAEVFTTFRVLIGLNEYEN